MGRVSRYKKIRRDDPFSKHPKEVDPTINQPVDQKKENKMSVSMKRFIALKNKALKIEKGDKMKKNNKNNNNNSDGSKNKKGNDSNNNNNSKQQKNNNKIEIMEGENFYDFQRRLNQETKKILIEEAKKSKKEKRNAYFEYKKLKKKLKNKDDDDDIPSFDKLVDNVKFGEIVDRPPKLTTLPRGAVPKSKPNININPSI